MAKKLKGANYSSYQTAEGTRWRVRWREKGRYFSKTFATEQAAKVYARQVGVALQVHSLVRDHTIEPAPLVEILTKYLVILAAKGDIPTAGIRRPKVASRARFLQPGELPTFLRALAEEPEPWRLFWTCCLFVGLRRGNVASARWTDIALDLGQWLVPEERSKTGAMLTVPIPGPVLERLTEWKAALPNRLLDANDARRKLLARGDAGVRDRLPEMTEAEMAEAGLYVFPSALVPGKTTASPHIVDPKASWRRLLLRAKLLNLRPHDLRRSIGSWMALGGVGLPIIGAALGHKDQRSTQVYARLNDGAVRAAMNRATDAMLAAGSSEEKSDKTDTTAARPLPEPAGG